VRLIFLGDIHANEAALEAVLAAARHRPVDGIFHLGNVVGYGPRPQEVIRRLQEAGIEGVRGSHDDRVATGTPLEVGGDGDDSGELAVSVCNWTREHLNPLERDWLQRLPFTRRLRSGNMEVALFNASPVDMSSAPHAQQTDDYFREMAGYSRAAVNVFAHTHVPFWRVVDGKWFVNAGSVGFSRDGDARAAFASVELNGGAAVRIDRIPYDLEATSQAIRDAGLPAGILRLLGAA
jgi:predicted phosphodiesterase